MTSMTNTAATVHSLRTEKQAHPERFCPNPTCLWRVVAKAGPNPGRGMQQVPLSPYGPDTFPDGFRAMTAAEGDALDATRHVLILDRATNNLSLWSIESYSQQRGWLVVLRHHGETVDSLRLTEDDPDFWSDSDIASGRARRGPESDNGRYVTIVPISTDDLKPLLRASFYPVVAQDVLRETREAREGWFHTSDGAYHADDADRRAHQRTLDEKAQREAQRIAEANERIAASDDAQRREIA